MWSIKMLLLEFTVWMQWEQKPANANCTPIACISEGRFYYQLVLEEKRTRASYAIGDEVFLAATREPISHYDSLLCTQNYAG